MKIVPCLALTLLIAGIPLSQAQSGDSQIIALTGTAAPGLIGRNFTSFSTAVPVLNGSGDVAFIGSAGSDIATGANVYALYKAGAGGPVIIARTSPSTESSQSAPLIGGTFTSFAVPLLNENGTVAFNGFNGTVGAATGLSVSGIYTGSGGALSTIAAYGQLSSGLGNVTDFENFSLADSGRVVFTGVVSDGPSDTSTPRGIFAGTGGTDPANVTATTIVSTTQTAPGGGLFTTFGSLVQNNPGVSGFTGTNSSNGAGIYTELGGTLATIATTLQAMPGFAENFGSFSPLAPNDMGSVAFSGTSADFTKRGVYTGSGGALTTIATTTQTAPGLAGNFTTFGDTVLSNSGLVAFRGVAPNGLGSNGHGIYTSSGGTLQTVATTLQAAPMLGGGNFGGFGKLAVNDLGTVAFAALTTTSAISAVKGLYLGDGQELVTAAYVGQSVSGTTISTLAFTGGADRGGNSQFNNNGQVVYRATFANGTSGILLFTPTLHFRNAAGGSWAARNNWTVGILPAAVHAVVIDPATALAVTGPLLPTTVKSLTVGSGAGLADLALQSSGTITATGGVSTFANGKIRGNGELVGNLTNAGTIAPGLPSSAGSISITGNAILQPTSHLEFDLGGLIRTTDYDYLSISGALTLGGSLDVALLGGFAPQVGDSFDLFDAAGTTGAFSLLNLPGLGAGLGWNTSLLPTTGVLTVVPEPTGILLLLGTGLPLLLRRRRASAN